MSAYRYMGKRLFFLIVVMLISNLIIQPLNVYALDDQLEGDSKEPEWTKKAEIVYRENTVEGKVYSDEEEKIIFTFENILSPGPSTPIVLYSDSELMLSTTYQEVYGDDFKNISFANENIGSIGISKIVFDYYYEDDIKKTKIYIYPKEALRYGENYSLNIDGSTFQTKSGESPKDIKVELFISDTAEYKIKQTYPENNASWCDEKRLKHDKTDDFVSDYFFIKITLYDENGNLELSNIASVKNIQVKPEGTDSNFLDSSFISKIESVQDAVYKQEKIDNFLFVKNTADKTATLYIPVKQLLSGTKYIVSIPSGVFYFPGDKYGNLSITWSFMTSTEPVVADVVTATVSEDYDEDEPIYIQGDFFYEDGIEDNKSVYIGEERAERVNVIEKTVLENGVEVVKKYLEVYLPDGSDRLRPGIYNIEVKNDFNHTTKILAVLSVVESGEYVPNEDYKIKKEEREGEVRASIDVSEDTLMLSSSYADDNYLKLDLDELMGEEVFLRKIKYTADKGDVLDILETKSTWADISLYKVRLDDNKTRDDIIIELGRINPTLEKSLKYKLFGKVIKSDFIKVSGENYKIDSVFLRIPFKNSSGKHLKVLRYDEATRNFYEEEFSVDLVEKRVNVKSISKGIFVVVEG
ncbi:hypothetical protein SAMN02745883_01275 [Caminicella sporogenes DSM 14501]|uniref:Ig-like domain-containing protein n=1 Tax=Caminicella sporogenes DSM 14501 TaxID=1121266 RepID=A0A1M6PRD1_9FIRM|nr:hypothetical protein [Caminicella sporogenes]RKD22006.1 hypothetical protein BET04_07080 [Caminicella sporogenes]SHK10495.1 hypothetical protein SAMN02745883_01275 [Caminicella sporogenes DSM 14501]